MALAHGALAAVEHLPPQGLGLAQPPLRLVQARECVEAAGQELRLALNPEVRGQRSEVRGQKGSGAVCLTSDL
jgi:hypothetical protein